MKVFIAREVDAVEVNINLTLEDNSGAYTLSEPTIGMVGRLFADEDDSYDTDEYVKIQLCDLSPYQRELLANALLELSARVRESDVH